MGQMMEEKPIIMELVVTTMTLQYDWSIILRKGGKTVTVVKGFDGIPMEELKVPRSSHSRCSIDMLQSMVKDLKVKIGSGGKVTVSIMQSTRQFWFVHCDVCMQCPSSSRKTSASSCKESTAVPRSSF
eukprot:768634-Hanusia_phi.AAC.10